VTARLPIRIRLTLAFTATLTLLVTALGVLVYTRHATGLNDAIDQGLAARAADLGPLEARDPGLLARVRLPEADETVEAILTPGGRVVDATPNTTPAAVEAVVASSGTIAAGREVDARLPGFDHAVRLLVVPAGGGRLAVAGTALADRDEALTALRRELLLALALVIGGAAVLSYAFAAAALRPVEDMRRRAATITAQDGDGRLPVPAADDELGRLGRTLNEMIDRMRAAVDRERRFAADASHELRTPLALLRTELDLALDGEHPHDELVAALRSASEETERLIRLTDDLLLLARADDDRLALRPTKLDPAIVAQRTADRFAPVAAEQRRAIVVRSPPGVRVTADEPALERALSNLVANALQHGQGEIVIETSGAPPQLRVRDGGDAPATDELFRRFQRGSAPTTPGSGLGLAIVAALAEAHGGSAGVTTADGHFTAWIALRET
jgi:signal transduction histidine kinase